MLAAFCVCLLAAIAGVAGADCGYTAYENVDLNGGDLPGQPVSQTVSTLADCAALCCANGYPCAAFAVNAGSPGQRACYLKYITGWTNDSISGVESGVLTSPPPSNFPWFNSTIPRPARVAALLSALTLDEMISWLDNSVPSIPRLGLPSYDWEGEALHGVAWAGVATVFPEPIAWGASFDRELVAAIADAISVEARAKWLNGLTADGSSSEFFGLSFMTPNNNLFVDGRWGRGQETYGEDPVLTSALVTELVNHLQFGDDPKYNKIIATSKHWLGYHLDSFGSDKQYRLSHSFNYSDTDIAQYYVLPFTAAVSADVTAVMCAYDGQNGTNPAWPNPGGSEPWGVPLCLNTNLQSLLRDKLGFSGYIISDEGAITFAGPGYHGYTPTVTDAACLAINAGTDLALGGEYGSTLGSCVSNGNVSSSVITRALSRLLSAQFDLGWFDTIAARRAGLPDPVPYNNVTVAANVSSPAHRELSLHAARQSLVLLKNSGNILPLNSAALSGRKIALVGPTASYDNTSTGSYIGNYSPCTDSPGAPLTDDPRCHVVTLLQALEGFTASAGIKLSYAPGCDVNTPNSTAGFPAAMDAVSGADIVIAALGLNTCQETACSEGEANDRLVTLDFPGSQLALLETIISVAKPGTPIILVTLNGGPISSPVGYANATAVLAAHYPGYEGGNAIVQALFGSFSPAGRLPYTIVPDISSLPPYTNTFLNTPPGRTYRYFTGSPLFPFGFGLSYANFTYSGLSVSPGEVTTATGNFTVSATLTHAGGFTSDEVVQVYGTFQAPSVGFASIPLQQLLGFTRVRSLSAGSATTVSITIPLSTLALVTPEGGDAVVSPGVWAITIGGGPPDNEKFGGGPVLRGKLTIAPSV